MLPLYAWALLISCSGCGLKPAYYCFSLGCKSGWLFCPARLQIAGRKNIHYRASNFSSQACRLVSSRLSLSPPWSRSTDCNILILFLSFLWMPQPWSAHALPRYSRGQYNHIFCHFTRGYSSPVVCMEPGPCILGFVPCSPRLPGRKLCIS